MLCFPFPSLSSNNVIHTTIPAVLAAHSRKLQAVICTWRVVTFLFLKRSTKEPPKRHSSTQHNLHYCLLSSSIVLAISTDSLAMWLTFCCLSRAPFFYLTVKATRLKSETVRKYRWELEFLCSVQQENKD
jgi:hypothetical protein